MSSVKLKELYGGKKGMYTREWTSQYKLFKWKTVHLRRSSLTPSARWMTSKHMLRKRTLTERTESNGIWNQGKHAEKCSRLNTVHKVLDWNRPGVQDAACFFMDGQYMHHGLGSQTLDPWFGMLYTSTRTMLDTCLKRKGRFFLMSPHLFSICLIWAGNI